MSRRRSNRGERPHPLLSPLFLAPPPTSGCGRVGAVLRAGGLRAVVLAVVVVVSCGMAMGCVYGVSYEGQPRELGRHYGKVVSADSALQLLAIDGVPVEYPSLGPIRASSGGFSARVQAGVHVFHCRYAPVNPDGHLPGESKRLDYGPAQIITLDIPSGMEIRVRVNELGGRRWEMAVEKISEIE